MPPTNKHSHGSTVATTMVQRRTDITETPTTPAGRTSRRGGSVRPPPTRRNKRPAGAVHWPKTAMQTDAATEELVRSAHALGSVLGTYQARGAYSETPTTGAISERTRAAKKVGLEQRFTKCTWAEVGSTACCKSRRRRPCACSVWRCTCTQNQNRNSLKSLKGMGSFPSESVVMAYQRRPACQIKNSAFVRLRVSCVGERDLPLDSRRVATHQGDAGADDSADRGVAPRTQRGLGSLSSARSQFQWRQSGVPSWGHAIVAS